MGNRDGQHRHDGDIDFVCEPDDAPSNLPEEAVFGFVPPPFKTRTLLKQVRSAALGLVEIRRARALEKLIHDSCSRTIATGARGRAARSP